MTRAIKKIPSKRRLALSGSIIQNHIEELFSPLQWLFPDRYKAKWRDWNDRYLEYVESSFGRVCIGVKPIASTPCATSCRGSWSSATRRTSSTCRPRPSRRSTST
jgi:hypothetical protein